MLNRGTGILVDWIKRDRVTHEAIVQFRDRVIAQGRKKNATRTGVIHVFAKGTKECLVKALAATDALSPGLLRALDNNVDWYRIAEHFMGDATV